MTYAVFIVKVFLETTMCLSFLTSEALITEPLFMATQFFTVATDMVVTRASCLGG
jgi:hypothetical protein